MGTAVVVRERRVVDAVVVVAIVLAMLTGLVPGIASAPADAVDLGGVGPGQFEIDGDTAVDGAPGSTDWGGVGGEQQADGTGDDDQSWFQASTKESDYPGWTFTTGGNANKADLHRLFVQTQTSAAGSYVWLGATRVSDRGNVQVTVEFNQDGLQLSDLGGSYRQVGDFFVRFNFPGGRSADVDVFYAVWSGSAWVDERELVDGSGLRAAKGTIGGRNREFVELEIDLDALFGDDPFFEECRSFGAASFRTESSGGSNDNNDPTLKDVGGPFPIDLDTCAELTVVKVDEDGDGLAGAGFTLYEGDDTDGEIYDGEGATNPCTTDETGTCSFGAVRPGTYTVDETVVPAGYRRAPGLPETVVVVEDEPLALGPYVDPRIPYSISVEPDGSNAVGNDHVFTVAVTAGDEPLAGADVDLVWDGAGDGITAVDGTAHTPGVASTTCTTDEAGACAVTVASGSPGSGVITASLDTPYQHAVAADGSSSTDDGAGGTVPLASVSDDATKTWTGYRAGIAADGLNLVGQDHRFTVTVDEVDGTGVDTPAADVAVTLAWDPGTAAGSSLDTTTCTTDVDGTCAVVAGDGGTPGTGTVSVVGLDGVVGDGEDLTVVLAAGEVAATKTWREYRARIDDDSVNPVGQAHGFVVTVEQRDAPEADWAPAPDGTTATWELTGDGVVDADASSCDDGTDDGACTIVVTADGPGVGTVTVTAVGGALLGDAGGPDETVDVVDVDATKTWLDVAVDVAPDGRNLVGEDHTFTVVVRQSDGGDYVPVPDGTVVTFELSDGGASLVSETCSTGTTDGGTCQIVVGSTTPAVVTVLVTGVAGHGGFDVPTDLTFERPGRAEKQWFAHRASIEADGLNLVGDAHRFTVTADVDGGAGWEPVADGTAVTVTTSGIAADVDQRDCADGTTDGTCEVVVSSARPGTVTVRVATVENLVATDSDVDEVEIDGDGSSATKTWIAMRPRISADAVNVTGDPHDFALAVDWTSDGTTWESVPDGSSIEVGSAGVGSVDDGGCDSTTDGGCTVRVSSDVGGERSVEVLGATARVVLGDLDETFPVVFAEGEPGTLAGLVDARATKTWAAYSLALTPLEAVNLLDGSEEDPERSHVVTATLSSDDAVNAPVGGRSIAVAISGTTGTISSVEDGTVADDDRSATCVTDTDGTCDVTIHSAVAGTAVLDASYAATVGESAPVDVVAAPATKVWTTFRVTVTPERATNLVGDPHVFTVRVEQSDPAGDCDGGWCPVEGVAPAISIVDSAGSAVVEADRCTDEGTGADGTCTVTVGSDEVTAVTLTARYEASVGRTVAAFSDSGDKSWIDYEVLVTPAEAENLVGTDHTFTVRVMTIVPAGDVIVIAPVVGAVPTLELSGPGSITTTTCGDGTDRYGECDVVIGSAVAGASTLTATVVAGAEGTGSEVDEGGAREYAGSGQKLWVDYRLVLDGDATNAVGDDHTFTATLTRDVGDGFLPVVGEPVEVAPLVGVGGLVGETCSTGTDEQGRCVVTVGSSATGTTTVAVSYDGVAGDTSATFGDEAVKTWVDIELVKEVVVGGGADGGDVELKDGLPTLTFVDTDRSATATSYEPQTAVYDLTVTNTGPVPLHDVTLVDDRIGVVLDGSEGVRLAPGESVTERVAETFSQEQAVDGLVVNTAVARATTEDGVTVERDDDAVVQLVTQLDGLLDVTLTKRALPGLGDLRADPDAGSSAGIVEWFGEEIDADATKRIPYELVVANTGGTPLTNVVLTDDRIGTILDGTEGVTLAPGESYEVIVHHEVTLSEAFALVDRSDTAFDLSSAQQANSYANAGLLRNTATVTTTDELGNQGPTATADERVRVVARKDVVTGFDQGLLLVLALVLLALGALVLTAGRRPAGGER